MALAAGRIVDYVQMRAEEHGEMKCDLGVDIVMDLAIGLAGPAAERRYSDSYADLPKRYRRSFSFWCTFHDDAVHNLALQSSNGDEDIAARYLEQAKGECTDHLQTAHLWVLINAIADELEIFGRLDGQHVARIAARWAGRESPEQIPNPPR